ncbi:MAG: RDD family protein [Bacteroidetes bacterium]|nr:RDD family protein [Bacteroidota bacterium]
MDTKEKTDEVFHEIPEFYTEKNLFGLDVSNLKKAKSSKFLNELLDIKIIGDYQYATLWIRIIAYLIDCLLIGILAALFLTMLVDTDIVAFSFVTSLVLLILTTLYYGYTESSEHQATIGKRIVGIKVIDLHGQRITFKKACLRYIWMFLSFLPLGAGIFAISWNKYGQAWHDIITDCLIIKVRKSNK